jgi:hypothetical protein
MAGKTRRQFRGRGVLPALVLTAGLLTGCGPASLRAHIPSLPHIYLFQNTSLVQTAPLSLLLPPGRMPGQFKNMGATTLDNAAAVSQPGTSPAAAAAFARWHRQDGATVTYDLVVQPTAGAVPSALSQVQIEVGRYATVQDAQGWFAQGARRPGIADVLTLPDPGIAQLNVAYQLTLPSLTAHVIYFQERNVVVRIAAIGPTGSAAVAVVNTIAQRERDLIAAAK